MIFCVITGGRIKAGADELSLQDASLSALVRTVSSCFLCISVPDVRMYKWENSSNFQEGNSSF